MVYVYSGYEACSTHTLILFDSLLLLSGAASGDSSTQFTRGAEMLVICAGCTAFEAGRVKDKVEDGVGKGRESARLVERVEGTRFSCKLSNTWLGWEQIEFEDI